MLTMHRATWPKLYADVIRTATKEGYARPSRLGEAVELGPAIVSCPAPIFSIIEGRNGSLEFARLSQLELLAGVNPTTRLLTEAPRFTRWREPDGHWNWPYGPRLVGQLEHVVWELHQRPFSRRAVAQIWKQYDLEEASINSRLNVPCAIALSFWIGPAGEVRTHAHIRSQDLWLGFYYDMPDFAFLQRCVAKALKRGIGQTYLTATSMHLYKKDLEKAAGVIGRIKGKEKVHALLPEPEGDSPVVRLMKLREWAQDQLKETTT